MQRPEDELLLTVALMAVGVPALGSLSRGGGGNVSDAGTTDRRATYVPLPVAKPGAGRSPAASTGASRQRAYQDLRERAEWR